MRAFILLISILTSGVAMADTNDCPPPGADAAAAVRQLNREYIDAVRRSDADWFREHMAANVVVILGSGGRLDKAKFLALFEAPKGYRSLTVRNVSARVFGATVQVDADAPWELADGSRGVSRYIDTWAWLDGRWRVISAQITPLEED